MPLTDTAIRNAKPAAKPFKVADGGGLTLLVNPDGSKWWRLRYRISGREKMLSLGVYPDVSLKQARERRDEARKLKADGVDPSAERRSTKASQANTFEAIATEWLDMQKSDMAEATYDKAKGVFENLIFPFLGKRPIKEINAADLLPVLKRIEERGNNETAHRTKQRCGQVFRYAIATNRAEQDPTYALRGALAPVVSTHHAAITDPQGIAALLRAIDGYQGHPVTECALKLAPLVFVRPGELRGAEWVEFSLDEAVWRIPGHRMKMGEAHVVPLSAQAVQLLRDIEPLTGGGKYVFPSIRSSGRPMSNNTVNAALRRLGYTSEQMTGHGFRALASTSLNEQGWHPDLIELQLAHAERNKIRAAYNRAQRIAERTKMMQAWANYLDGLRAGAVILPIKRTA